MKLNAISAFAAACCMGATQPVLGVSITFDVLGRVNRIADPGGVTGVAAGDPFSGSLTYDLATPDYTPDPRLGDYIHLAPLGANGVVLSVGQMSVATDPTRNWVVEVGHDPGAGVEVLNAGSSYTPGISVGSDHVDFPTYSFVLYRTSPPWVLTDDRLPENFTAADFPDHPVVMLAGWKQNSPFTVWFAPESIAKRIAPVPEAGSGLAMLGATALAMIWLKGRCRADP